MSINPWRFLFRNRKRLDRAAATGSHWPRKLVEQLKKSLRQMELSVSVDVLPAAECQVSTRDASMKVEATRHLHRGCYMPRRTTYRSLVIEAAARKNLQDSDKCRRCSLREIGSTGLNAKGDAILASLDRDCELRHLYLRQRWQRNIS
jgi:hypothetical protein